VPVELGVIGEIRDGRYIELYKNHSHKELMRYLSKDKMVRTGEEGKWKACKKLAYIDSIISTLGI
jgi:hypothetical protein